MALTLTEDQELIAKTARDFALEESPVSRMRALRDSGDATGFSRDLWKQMAELGWVGIPFPESVGGAGMGFAELAFKGVNSRYYPAGQNDEWIIAPIPNR